MQARVLAVMGMVALGFLAFTVFTSNPFERLLPMLSHMELPLTDIIE